MRILLVKLKHIGDALLLTPTILGIKSSFPEAEIWVVVRRGCEGILIGCPEITRVLTVAPVDKSERRSGDFWGGLGTMATLAGTRFDHAFELGDGHRGRLLARMARARQRSSVKTSSPLPPTEAARFRVSTFDWETCHRIEKDYRTVAEFLLLPEEIPALRFARERTVAWSAGEGLRDICVVQVGTRQGFNRWHRDGWRELCRALLERCENVVVSCGPADHERAETAWLRAELGPRLIDTQGALSWAQLAGLLYRAQLYAGLNTAAMHLAAACGCPIVALFGQTWEGHWRPWRAPHRIVSDTTEAPRLELAADLTRATQRTMSGIPVDRVIAACVEMLNCEPNRARNVPALNLRHQEPA